MFNNKKQKLIGLLAGLVLAFSAHAQIFGSSNPILCANADLVTSPCFAWSLNPRTGFYQPALNQIGVSINGSNVGTWTATGYSSPFASTALSYFATGIGTFVGVANSGVQIWASPTNNAANVTMIDNDNTANNKAIEWNWNVGVLSLRFLSDDRLASALPLQITGGQGSGITGINSNSGTGTWAHTGSITAGTDYSTVGSIILLGKYTSGNLVTLGGEFASGGPVLGYGVTPSTAASGAFFSSSSVNTFRAALNIDGGFHFYTGPAQTTAVGSPATGMGEQVRITHTPTATRYITLTGSNGANPNISTSVGSLAFGTSLVVETTAPSLSVGSSNLGTGDASIDIGVNRTGSGYAFIDFVGDTTYTDYGLRLVRNNGGANTTSQLIHRGTGELNINTSEAARIAFYTTATERAAISSGGQLTVVLPGPHAIGGGVSGDMQFLLNGTFTGSGTGARGLQVLTTLTPPANGYGMGIAIQPTMNKASSGTHPDFASLYIDAPSIGAGAATLTNSTTLKITGAPSVGTNLRALWVVGGVTETVNHRLTGFTFANIATNIPTNGDIGYCSDCTIANPCAGGGTGALAKRLNGINVCN